MLTKLNDNIYVYQARTNIVFIKNHSIMIDTGINDDIARKALRESESLGIRPSCIIGSHHHVDHVGGNLYAVRKTGARIIMSEVEKVLVKNTFLSQMLDLGVSLESNYSLQYEIHEIEQVDLPRDIKILNLAGHSPGMIGLVVDKVVFTSDLFFPKEILDKYIVPYHLDIQNTYHKLEEIKSVLRNKEFVIPSHGPIMNIETALKTIDINIERILYIKKKLLDLVIEKEIGNYDSIISALMYELGARPNSLHHMFLSRRALESYVYWLVSEGVITILNNNNSIYIEYNHS